jgi:hypothetical protein
MRTWPTCKEEGRSEDCSASCVAEKTDLILCTDSPKSVSSLRVTLL